MKDLTRREFVALAASLGAGLACAGQPRQSNQKWAERRDHFAEGVASGDPDFQSVLLWTRASLGTGDAVALTLEESEYREFTRVVSSASALAVRAADYTCRVLATNLRENSEYWYRFTDAAGRGSRIGRTRTAPIW